MSLFSCHYQTLFFIQTEVFDSATEKQSKTHSFRSGSPTGSGWSSKSSMCGSDRTGWATSSRMSDSVTSDSHPAHRAGAGLARAGRAKISSAEDHCMDQMDSFSVSSAGGYGAGGAEAAGGGRVYLTPAQVALQEQLKSKHSELSRRIALQQAELIRSVSQSDQSLRSVTSLISLLH